MRLVSVYDVLGAPEILYKLLAERPAANFISHRKMPSIEEHAAFIKSKPFRYWYLIGLNTDGLFGSVYAGAIEVTYLNEVGVAIFDKYRRKGYGYQALDLFFKGHEPLHEIPAIRNGHWLANIAVRNVASKEFFGRFGFKPIQETWSLE